jgi:predicted RecB family nuclease
MDAQAKLSLSVFSAYLRCPTKAFLMAAQEVAPSTYFADLMRRISDSYKAKTLHAVANAIEFSELTMGAPHVSHPQIVDCTNCWYVLGELPLKKHSLKKLRQTGEYIPLVYSAFEKIDKFAKLEACFAALAVVQALQTQPSQVVIIVHGCACSRVTIPLDQLNTARSLIHKISSSITTRPPLIINNHCSICDFNPICRKIAIERDNLSLLSGMPDKERRRYEERGTTTIIQLSYQYRPRRRKRIKGTPNRTVLVVKNDQKLKALAIKKCQAHIVDLPAFSINGTPVFIDVEADIERGYYYLIGIRYKIGHDVIERSFWACEKADEESMWREFLALTKNIEHPRLVFYGAYEFRFLKKMKDKWGNTNDIEFIDYLLDNAVNLLAVIYGKVYFPTYSNSLKEVANWLGFR